MNQVGPAVSIPRTAWRFLAANSLLPIPDESIWNDTTSLTNGKPADGYTGKRITNFQYENGTGYGRLAADRASHLWLIDNVGADGQIDIYSLP